MKTSLAILLASTLLTSTAMAQKSLQLQEDMTPETQILQYVTDVKTMDFDSISAKVFTTASFGDSDEVAYLVLAKMYGYDPADKTSAIYNLDSTLGTRAMIRNIEKKGSNIIITTITDGVTLRKVVLKINGLSVSK